MVATAVVMVSCGDAAPKTKFVKQVLKAVWLHRKATTFNRVGTRTTSGKLKLPVAVNLEESCLIVPRCVRTHEMLEKSHFLLSSQACGAKLGMVKRVRDGTISLDGYGRQKLEVVRQAGIGLFMIRIDHLIFQDFLTNPLLSDMTQVEFNLSRSHRS